MNDILEIHDPGMKCNTFLHEDGKTVMHFGPFPKKDPDGYIITFLDTN
jgi:hypothetical protein